MSKKEFLAGLRRSNHGAIGVNVTLKIYRDEKGNLIIRTDKDRDRVQYECSDDVIVLHPSSGWPTEKVYQAVLNLAEVLDNEHRAHPEYPDFIPGQNHH